MRLRPEYITSCFALVAQAQNDTLGLNCGYTSLSTANFDIKLVKDPKYSYLSSQSVTPSTSFHSMISPSEQQMANATMATSPIAINSPTQRCGKRATHLPPERMSKALTPRALLLQTLHQHCQQTLHFELFENGSTSTATWVSHSHLPTRETKPSRLAVWAFQPSSIVSSAIAQQKIWRRNAP